MKRPKLTLTPERIAEIDKMPMFHGVVYGDVTQAELDAYMAHEMPEEQRGRIMRKLWEKMKDGDASDT